MKNLLTLLILLAFAGVSMAQSSCSELEAAYSKEEIFAMGDKAEFLCFLANEGMQFSDMTGKDLAAYPDISTLTPKKSSTPNIDSGNFDKDNFNILLYNYKLKERQHQVFRIGDSGMVLTLHSSKRLEVMHDRHKINQASQNK